MRTYLTASVFSLALLPLAHAATVYVVNSGNDTIGLYDVGNNGALHPQSTPSVATGAFPQTLAFDPAGDFAYVSNGGSNSVISYRVERGSGALLPLSFAPVATDVGPIGLVVRGGGGAVYTGTAQRGRINAYTAAADGSLTPLGAASVAAGQHPMQLASSADGRHLYAADVLGGTVLHYKIRTDGSLVAPPYATPAGRRPIAIVLTPDGRHAYAADHERGLLWQWQVSADTGTLTPLQPATVAAGHGPHALALSPDGRWLYAAVSGDLAVFAYAVEADGQLRLLPGGQIDNLDPPTALAVDADGRFLDVVNSDTNSITRYAIDPNSGALQRLDVFHDAGLDRPVQITIR